MTRHGLAASCVIAILAASQAWALSVGEPQTLSYLSEPLQVHLPVSDWAGVPVPERFRLRLLPDTAYAEFGLSAPQNRPADLSVQWRHDSASDPYVVIRTQSPITEPILTLLLELRSGKQVAVRQIDLLLDLPAGIPARMPGMASPVAAPRPTITRPSVRTGARSYGPVRPGESLSRIAQKVRPDSSISLARMAGALAQANPQAFFGDAHDLKVGVTLRIPSLAEIRSAPRLESLYSTPRRRTASRARAASPKRPPAFLPRAIYTRGRLWALTMEFPSYEAIRPVDLTPKLKALEAKEPLLFKADWTLNSTGANKLQRQSTKQTASQPSAAPQQVPVQAQPVATATPQPVEQAPPPVQGQQAAEPVMGEPAKSTESVTPATPQPQPQSSERDRPETAAPIPLDDPAPTNSSRWPWLLAVFGLIGALLWWRRGHFTIAIPVRDDEHGVTSHNEPDTASSQASLQQQRGIARLQKRLAPWLQASNSDQKRQAQVAQALLERGRLDQAQRLIEELEQAPANTQQVMSAPSEALHADSPPDAEKPYNPGVKATDAKANELDQRRIQKRLIALRRKGLPAEAQRQLKVAEAFFDRGDFVQAHAVLSGLSTSSAD